MPIIHLYIMMLRHRDSSRSTFLLISVDCREMTVIISGCTFSALQFNGLMLTGEPCAAS
jgi:hypothetical protein